MPRSYLRPRARPYAFNTDYYLNLSKSSGSTIESEKVEVTNQSDAQSLVEVKQEPRVTLAALHPYRLPVEDVRVPPHESSEWPSSVPHFNLVSSYDLMVQFLGIGCKNC